MPGFFITDFDCGEDYKIKNYNQSCSVFERKDNEYLTVERNVLDSFLGDKIFFDNEDYTIATDGVLLNDKELLEQYGSLDITHLIIRLYERSFRTLLDTIIGSYSGIIYDKRKNTLYAFTSHMGERAVFYYFDEDSGKYIIGSQLNYLTDFMKYHKMPKPVDKDALRTLLEFGYFVDDRTGISTIKRLFPGDYLKISDGKMEIKSYYKLPEEYMYFTEDEAIRALDKHFNKAIDRIGRKNKEKELTNLVDLSGGLDSRINAFTFKELGYENSILMTYSQLGSLDAHIAANIANYLGYDWYFKSLDNGSSLLNIDENVFMNSGTSYYLGITGGKNFLEILNHKKLGMEVTGVLGDIRGGTMIINEGTSKPKLEGIKFQVNSNPIMDNTIYSTVIERFEKQEIFWMYLRGALAGLSTFLIRQNFIEPVTPFGDKEFLNAFYSIPWEMRAQDSVTFKWFAGKYPDALKFQYATTAQRLSKDTTFHIEVSTRIKNKISDSMRKVKGHPSQRAMNPLNYWYENIDSVKNYMDRYFMDNIDIIADEGLRKRAEQIYRENKVTDKSIALTLISYYKNFII